MSDELITNGIEAVNKGDKKLARQLLGDAIRDYPNDERSWGWFYNVAENDTERLRCVKQVLRINPNNTRAKQLLEKLRGSIPLSVEAGKSTRKMAEERRRMAIWIAILGFGIIVVISLYVVKNYRVWAEGGTAVLILFLFGYPILTRLLDSILAKKLKEEKRAIRGAQSEEKIGEMLAELSEDFLVLHDIESPFGNIDHIVISKRNGLFLIETKSHGGHVTIEDDLQVNGKPPEKDFITQTLNNTYWLKQEISNLIGPTPWITPILVFTDAFVVAPKTIKNIRIMNKKYLINSLNRLGDKKNIANDQIWEQRGKIAQQLVGKE